MILRQKQTESDSVDAEKVHSAENQDSNSKGEIDEDNFHEKSPKRLSEDSPKLIKHIQTVGIVRIRLSQINR